MRILSPLLLAAALSVSSVAAWAESTLTVTGTASVASVPDLATVSLGVTTNGKTAAEALAANSEALAAVLARVQAAGIEAKDTQTTGLSLNPNWVSSSSSSASEIQGYVATNMLTIRVRSLDKVGPVLDAAVSDGANTLNGLTFGLQNPRPSEDEARKAAVADAMARAKLIATAAGAELGSIVSISEGGVSEPMPGVMFKAADAMAVPVAGGEVAVSASVTMVFQLAE